MQRWCAGRWPASTNARSGEARTTGGTLRGRRLRCTVRWSSPAARRARRNPTISGAGQRPAHRRGTKSPVYASSAKAALTLPSLRWPPTCWRCVQRWSAGLWPAQQMPVLAKPERSAETLRGQRWRCAIRRSISAARRARRDPTISRAGREACGPSRHQVSELRQLREGRVDPAASCDGRQAAAWVRRRSAGSSLHNKCPFWRSQNDRRNASRAKMAVCTVRWSISAARRARRNPTISRAGREACGPSRHQVSGLRQLREGRADPVASCDGPPSCRGGCRTLERRL